MIQELHYIVDLRRRPTYYVFVLYVPTFIVTLLSLTGLFTPFNNEGERVERVSEASIIQISSKSILGDVRIDNTPIASRHVDNCGR